MTTSATARNGPRSPPSPPPPPPAGGGPAGSVKEQPEKAARRDGGECAREPAVSPATQPVLEHGERRAEHGRESPEEHRRKLRPGLPERRTQRQPLRSEEHTSE